MVLAMLAGWPLALGCGDRMDELQEGVAGVEGEQNDDLVVDDELRAARRTWSDGPTEPMQEQGPPPKPDRTPPYDEHDGDPYFLP